VRVEIDRATGALRIAKAYSVLECGNALVPQVVIGQAQGGFAMGVGYTFLEALRPISVTEKRWRAQSPVLALFHLIIRFMTHLQQFDNLLTH
jgi:xanthine dehydrogenase molybdopterin-binding subunit B